LADSWLLERYASEPPICTVPAIASLIPFPEPPADGASVTLEYFCVSGVSSSCRKGYRRLEPDSLRVVAAVGLPVVGVTDADVGGVVAAVVEDVLDDELELQAARPTAATNASGTIRFTVFLTSCRGPTTLTQPDELLMTPRCPRA